MADMIYQARHTALVAAWTLFLSMGPQCTEMTTYKTRDTARAGIFEFTVNFYKPRLHSRLVQEQQKRPC